MPNDTPDLIPGQEIKDEFSARDFFEVKRWNGTTQCPFCRRFESYLLRPVNKHRKKRAVYRPWICSVCTGQFTCTTWTPLHGARRLHVWLKAWQLLKTDPAITVRELQAKLEGEAPSAHRGVLKVSTSTVGEIARRLKPLVRDSQGPDDYTPLFRLVKRSK